MKEWKKNSYNERANCEDDNGIGIITIVEGYISPGKSLFYIK